MKTLNTYLSKVLNEKIRLYDIKTCQFILNLCPPIYITTNLKTLSNFSDSES